MKKLFTTLTLCAGLSFGAFAQHCAADSTSITPPPPASSPGLSPNSASLAPARIGVPISDTIYFTNYTSFSSIHVNYLKIDSINNLPNGLCWVTNKSNNTFNGGESGIIYVSGTPTSVSAPGQYKLVIYIDVSAQGLPAFTNQNAEQLTGQFGSPLRYYVRLNCHNDTVWHPIDTTGETALHTVFEAYPGSYCPSNGVVEVSESISDLTVVPNPISSSSKVIFNSSVEGTYTLKMVSLLGSVVASKEVEIVRGENTIEQDRNGLSAGVYLMSLSNGQSSVTRKVIVE